MANQKNENNKSNNSHKRVYRRKKNPMKRVQNKEKENTIQGTIQQQHTANKQQDLGTTDQHNLEGSRVINLERLQQFADDLTEHSTICDGSMTLN